MGCKGSKLDEQEAVALCRGRADLLAAAVRHRYALADAHADLAASLVSFADALHLLLSVSPPSPPRLSLPPHGKTLNSSSPLHRSSHLRFGSSSGSGSEIDSVPASPLHPRPQYDYAQPLPVPGHGFLPEPAFAYPQSGLHFYYAKSRPPQASVAVEQRPPDSAFVFFGSFGPESDYPSYPQVNSYGYGYYGGDAAPPPASGDMGPTRQSRPPPSPPRANTWDFLNPFDTYETEEYGFYTTAAAAPPYTPSRSSREVREEEGIPELEEDEQEVVKEAYGDATAAVPAAASVSEYSTAGSNSEGRSSSHRRRSSVGASSIAELEEETVVVDKEVVSGEARRQQESRPQRRSVSARAGDDVDVAGEIKAQFKRASDAARELERVLEVGRRRYHPRNSAVYHVSSRMVSAMAPHSGPVGVECLDIGVEKVAGGRSLSLTLQKLYIWERKLYDEVKDEEKMRLLLAKNSKRLNLLAQKGAEADKIEATQNLVRKLSTKIRIAVRVIAKISKKMNKVRDEELGPQINALIQGFVKMWQDKLECYQIQCQVISEAKNLDSIESSGKGRDLAMQLELELIKCIVNFSSWVNAQRNFVKALNAWLALCLNHDAEETSDGVPPYSPGRIGAPPVFVICNNWSQAMDRISERNVVDAMQALVSSVRHLWEQQNLEQSEQIIAIRERERWIKMLEKKALEINKEADALNRKLALVPGQRSLPPTCQLYEAHFPVASSLHTGLRHVLEALENFAANSLQAFKEILRQTEEDRLARENAKVP